MRICDRCGPERAIKATERIYAESEGMEIDLCRECYDIVIQAATTIPKRKNKKAPALAGEPKRADIH